jgi:HPt (histidine-containing phosphotransfer) domain-containing protein
MGGAWGSREAEMRGQSAAKARPTGASSRQIRGPIDLDHLRRQTLGDSGLEMEVLRLFDQMTHVYYGRLESSTTVTDLLTNLHTLKGAAAGVGAFGLAELARVAETELRGGSPVNPERIDDLHMAVEELSTFISARLKQQAA